MNFLILFGICLTPKLSKFVTFSAIAYNANDYRVPVDSYSARFTTYASSFILSKLFLE